MIFGVFNDPYLSGLDMIFDSLCIPPVPYAKLLIPKDISDQPCFFYRLGGDSFPDQEIIKVFRHSGHFPIDNCPQRAVVLLQIIPCRGIHPDFIPR